MSRKSAEWVALLLCGAALLTFFLVCASTHDVVPADEPRYAQVAREMRESGDYLAPHVNGQVYREKPPLLFWSIALASLPFDDVTELAARIPSSVAATLVILLTYLLGRACFDRRTGFWSAAVLTTTQRFWYQAGRGQIDMVLTLCMMVSLCAFWLWHTRKQRRWLVAFYVVMGAGLLAKGPPALMFPLLLVLAFYWRRPAERKQTHWILGTLGSLVILGLWLIPARMAVSDSAARQVVSGDVLGQIIGRVFLGISKARPPWYYLTKWPGDWLPWTLLLPWVVLWGWRHRRDSEAMRLLLSWTVPAFVFFSLSVGKRAVYLLPLFPAVAIIIGRSLTDLMDGEHALWRKRTGFVWALILLVFASLPIALRYTQYADLSNWGIGLLGACALAASLDTFLRVRRTTMRSLPGLIAGHFIVLVLLGSLFIYPMVNALDSAKPICAPIRVMAERGDNFELYSLGLYRDEYVYYSHHFLMPLLVEREFLSNVKFDSDKERDAVQRHIEKTLSKAMASVDVDWTRPVSSDTVELLRKTAKEALQEQSIEPLHAHAYLTNMAARLVDFDNDFSGEVTAYAFVRDEFWALLVMVRPELARFSVMAAHDVGHRHMLLITNTPLKQN